MPERNGKMCLLDHGEAQPAIFLSDRQAKQAHGLHLGNDRLGNGVPLLHLRLQRAQSFVNKALDRVEQQAKCFRVQAHDAVVSPTRQPIT